MSLEQWYESQARTHPVGEVSGRVRKAGDLLARLAPRCRVLVDLGCGSGEVGAYLARRVGAEVVWGIDIAERNLASARERGLRTARADLNRDPLPLEEASADALFCGELLQYLYNPDHLAREARRVLKPGGVAVFTAPNLASWFNRLALLMGWQPFFASASLEFAVGRPLRGWDRGSATFRVWTLRALREFFTAHGLPVVAVRGVALADDPLPPLSPLLGWVVRLDALLSRRPAWSARVILACRKAP